MSLAPWQLAELEEYGYTDTNDGLINRVAYALTQSPGDNIDTDEFRRACVSVGVDPDSFTGGDLSNLQRKLGEIT